MRIQDRETDHQCAISVLVYDVAVTAVAAIRNRRAETSDHGVSTLSDTPTNKAG